MKTKKKLFFPAAVLLCGLLLGACGGDAGKPEASFQGNNDSFNMNAKQLSGIVAGAWVNRDDPDETVTVHEDFSFVHRRGKKDHNGKMTLKETSGMLTVTYDDSFLPEKTYVWVDNKKNINANTWYVDGGSFSFGGAYYIKS